jgi:hypothetical protein
VKRDRVEQHDDERRRVHEPAQRRSLQIVQRKREQQTECDLPRHSEERRRGFGGAAVAGEEDDQAEDCEDDAERDRPRDEQPVATRAAPNFIAYRDSAASHARAIVS